MALVVICRGCNTLVEAELKDRVATCPSCGSFLAVAMRIKDKIPDVIHN